MSTICGANCDGCTYSENCKGCEQTCGQPFGGTCVAAEYIKVGGREAYTQFKQNLLNEINSLLEANDIPKAEALYELPGAFVNLAYPIPNGDAVKFLDDKKIYLGTQIEFADLGVCYGVVADTGFNLYAATALTARSPSLSYIKRGKFFKPTESMLSAGFVWE